MTNRDEPAAGIFCPLCGKRLPDTKVEYDEVLSSETSVVDGIMGQNPNFIIQRSHDVNNVASTYTNNSHSVYGELMVCAECAANYERSVSSRARSRPLMTWAIVALIAGIVVFISTLAPGGSLWELLALIPLVAAVVLFASGLGVSVIGRSLAQPMRHYLAHSYATAAK